MSIVLYPGSFDPITKGHMNIVEQASEMFDEVIIAIMHNSAKKNSMFTVKERLEMISELYHRIDNVRVIAGEGATVDVAIENECKAIIRGLRSLADFDSELALCHINREISDNRVNTVCLFADQKYQFVSSSMVKELFYLDKDFSPYVDPIIYKKMIDKRKSLHL